jgi:hypothetical protein
MNIKFKRIIGMKEADLEQLRGRRKIILKYIDLCKYRCGHMDWT